MRAATATATMSLLGAASACVADPLTAICPTLAYGELVITEIRGNLGDSSPTSTGVAADSTGADESTTGVTGNADRGRDWVEFVNLTDREIDLHGLVLRNIDGSGSNETFMRVRYHRAVGAGDIYVLGLIEDESRPSFVDYGVGDDFTMDDSNLQASGAVQLQACGEEIDTVLYAALPTTGTWSLGVMPPDADANGSSDAWCEDPVLSVFEGREEPGTPGEVNRPCD